MLPQELKQRRTKLGLTQKQLAEYLEVQKNTVARWERGEMAIARPRMLRVMLDLAEDDPELTAIRREGNYDHK